MDTSIQKTYHDALFYASASFNKETEFYLTPSEFKVLLKLIHYSTTKKNLSTNKDITFQNKDISSHIFLSELTVKDSIESLLRKKYITSTRDILKNTSGFKSKRTININWDLIKEISKIIILNETTKNKFKYNSQDGTPKEVNTSSYDEGGTPVEISKEYKAVLSNDKVIDEPISQPKEIVSEIKDKVPNPLSSFIDAIPNIKPQPKIEETEDGILKDYKFYYNRLCDEFYARKRKGEKFNEGGVFQHLKQSWDAGKIKSTNQVTKESLNKVIDKYKIL